MSDDDRTRVQQPWEKAHPGSPGGPWWPVGGPIWPPADDQGDDEDE